MKDSINGKLQTFIKRVKTTHTYLNNKIRMTMHVGSTTLLVGFLTIVKPGLHETSLELATLWVFGYRVISEEE